MPLVPWLRNPCDEQREACTGVFDDHLEGKLVKPFEHCTPGLIKGATR